MLDNARAVISVVDDDESVREAVGARMESLGFGTRTFSTAIDFLASPGIEDTSCMVVDVYMPHMTGVELHGRLIDLGYAIPTILITAHPDEDVRAGVMADGVICYLVKPFDDDELLHCIYLALGD
jgi:FixJ family two-component response regulator